MTEKKKKAQQDLMEKSVMERATTKFVEKAKQLQKQMPELLKGLNYQRVIYNGISALSENLKGQGINWGKVNLHGCQTGLIQVILLELDAENNEVYPVPYYNKKTGLYDINWQRSYLGEIKVRKKYSIDKINKIECRLVREGDDFQFSLDNEKVTYTFKPKAFSDKPIVGGFVFVDFENGTSTLRQFSRAQLEKYKKASMNKMGGKLSPAWKLWEDEMFKAKMMKAAMKDIPFETQIPEIDSAIKETDTEVLNDNDTAIESDFEIVGDIEDPDIENAFKSDENASEQDIKEESNEKEQEKIEQEFEQFVKESKVEK